jgi:non-specific serine/threonine protein kinase
VLDGVASLLDKSLLREEQSTGEPRLLMLETIREYGLEQLQASGEAPEVHRRHAVYYLQLAETAEPLLHGPDQVEWLDRLEAEHDNFGASLAWTQSQPEGASFTLRLASALLWFWLVRGYYGEGRRALEEGIAGGEQVEPAVRTKALRALGHLTQYQGDLERSTKLLEESIRIDESQGNRAGVAAALSLLGETARFQRDYERATRLLEQSLAMQQDLGDRWASYHTLYRLAEAASDQSDIARATELHEQSLSMRRERGDTRAIAAAVKCLGLLALARGDYDNGARTLREGVATYRATRDKQGIANCLEGLAGIALAQKEPIEAARLLGAVAALLDQVGGRVSWAGRYERDLGTTRTRLDENAFERAFSEGRAMSLDDAIAHALAPTEVI